MRGSITAAVATCAEVAALDAALVRELGFTNADLMEIAGIGCFLGFRDLLGLGSRVVVACGPGQNGGDGFVVARYLRAAGFSPRVFATSVPKPGSAAAAHFRRLAPYDVNVTIGSLEALRAAIAQSDFVVDAIFGTGVRLPLGEATCAWIAAVDGSAATVVAIDLPSGMNGDDGEAPSGSVRAHRTVTIGAVKPGLVTPHGAAIAGEIRLAPLPYPPSMVANLPTMTFSPGAD